MPLPGRPRRSDRVSAIITRISAPGMQNSGFISARLLDHGVEIAVDHELVGEGFGGLALGDIDRQIRPALHVDSAKPKAREGGGQVAAGGNGVDHEAGPGGYRRSLRHASVMGKEGNDAQQQDRDIGGEGVRATAPAAGRIAGADR